ncbi:hypothetical protein CLI85_07705 [Tannerella forsythia]|nr:hypothetical protein CLI85_07705 [Tannerella forsythia]
MQVGKSGNSLRFGQPDFLSPRSLLRRLTAGINCQWLIVNGYFPGTRCTALICAICEICVRITLHNN